MKAQPEALAPLFRYPGPDYAGLVRALARERPALAALEKEVQGKSVEELQELYTRTFDLSPLCTLDLGWHLFGEDYARGVFLARLRGEHRRLGVDEAGELPDHLPTVLSLLPRLGPEEGLRFRRDFLLPALDKMAAKLKEAASPYAGALEALMEEAGAPAKEAVHG